MGGAGVFLEAVEIEAIVRHLGDGLAVALDQQVAAGIGNGIEAAGDEHGSAIAECVGFEIGVGNSERDCGTIERDAVGAKAIGDGLFDLGEHLIEIENFERRIGQAKMRSQSSVGEGGDAGLPGAANIDGNAVDRAVMNRRDDALSGVHGMTLVGGKCISLR